jgi:two-component system heavy metal sensor histidine kinase CusS
MRTPVRMSTARCWSLSTEMPASSRARSRRSLRPRDTSRAPVVAAPTRKRSRRRAATARRGLAAERQIDLKIAGPGHPLQVGVEAELGKRILQPVIENACRYGSSNVRVGIERYDSTVLYTVEDDGVGVENDEHERIFEPGARGSAGESNGSNGAGLGLPLARRLARSVSGDLVADPSESGGRFVIRLPGG